MALADLVRDYSPIHERNGRLSVLRAIVFAAVLVPALYLAWRAGVGDLGPRPWTEAIHRSGDWAIRLIALTLLITPLRNMSGWSKLVGLRRMLGVASLGYALVHFALYIGDQSLDLAKVASEIALRVYLTIGFVALVGLVALGVTSTDGMIKRLGAARWQRLHALVHPIAILALVHYFIQSKLDVTEPLIVAGLMLALWVCRGVARHRIGLSLPITLAIAAGSGLATALAEATWYWARTGVDPRLVLNANLMFEPVIRPGWWVAGIAAAVAVAAALKKIAPGVRKAVPQVLARSSSR